MSKSTGLQEIVQLLIKNNEEMMYNSLLIIIYIKWKCTIKRKVT